MKSFFFDCGTRDPLASGGLLILRVGFGLMMMIGHGLYKWQHYAEILPYWDLVPNVWPLSYLTKPMSFMAAIGIEVFASALLVLGLAARPAAFLLAFTMLVAVFQAHGNDPLFMAPGVKGAKEMAVLYLLPMLVVVVTGAGKFSLDAPLSFDRRRRRR